MRGVGMKKNPLLPADIAYAGNILNRADFLIGMLDGNQNRLIRNRVSKLVNINEAFVIHVQVGCPEALPLKGLGAVEHREVLDFGHDYMIAFLFTERQSNTLQGKV